MSVIGVPGVIRFLVKKRVSCYRICQREIRLWFSYLFSYSIIQFTVYPVNNVTHCGLFPGYLGQSSCRVKIGYTLLSTHSLVHCYSGNPPASPGVTFQSNVTSNTLNWHYSRHHNAVWPIYTSFNCPYTLLKSNISFLNYHQIGQVNQKTWVKKGRAHSLYIASSHGLSSLHT